MILRYLPNKILVNYNGKIVTFKWRTLADTTLINGQS